MFIEWNTVLQWEQTISISNNVCESHKLVSKTSHSKDCMLYDSTYIKFKNRQNYKFMVLEVKKVLYLGRREQWIRRGIKGSYGWLITLYFLVWAVSTRMCPLCDNSLNVHLWLIHFSVCMFYFIQKKRKRKNLFLLKTYNKYPIAFCKIH